MMDQDIESLDAEYAAIAADAEREAEAREWIEGLLYEPEWEEASLNPRLRRPCCR
jgi:hypothetical protein